MKKHNQMCLSMSGRTAKRYDLSDSAIAEFGGRLIALLSISRDDASLDPLIRARSWRGFTHRAAPEKMGQSAYRNGNV